MKSDLPVPPRRRRVLLLLGWYSPRTEEGIVRYARDANWALDLQTMRTGALPDNRGIDGILSILGGWGTRPEFSDFVRQTPGIPVVDMHADEAATIPAGRVLADNVTVGRLAAEHFLERGFTQALFCCKSLTDWSTAEREAGFRARLEESGVRQETLECYRKRRDREFMARHCIARLEQHLTAATRPLAVFAENDDFALLVLDACARTGLRVPEEVAVLGCGNDPLVVEFAPVPLSSVEHDFVTRSYLAAQLLDRLMSGAPVPDAPIRVKPTGVVMRHSTDILAVPDPRVTAALNLIRQRFADPSLASQDIADLCGINLRTLNRSFLKNLGRSIADEIRLVRLRHAQHLLGRNGLNVSQVADASGFANLLHFRRTLKRHAGMSPRQWRAIHKTAE